MLGAPSRAKPALYRLTRWSELAIHRRFRGDAATWRKDKAATSSHRARLLPPAPAPGRVRGSFPCSPHPDCGPGGGGSAPWRLVPPERAALRGTPLVSGHPACWTVLPLTAIQGCRFTPQLEVTSLTLAEGVFLRPSALWPPAVFRKYRKRGKGLEFGLISSWLLFYSDAFHVPSTARFGVTM